jgi:hypothetical protein
MDGDQKPFQFTIFEMLGLTTLVSLLLAQGRLARYPECLPLSISLVIFLVGFFLASRRDRRASLGETVVCAALVATAIVDAVAWVFIFGGQ